MLRKAYAHLLAGLPEGADGDRTPCWINSPFPPGNLAILDWQWEQRVVPYWREQARYAQEHGCVLCFEIHGGDVVYNPDTLLRLRDQVGAGDTIACIGTRACLYDHYWARLAGVRILTEIYEPERPLNPYFVSMPNRDHVYDVLRREGAKVLVGYFEPGLMTNSNPVTAGWRELDQTPFYALPLNLPAESAPASTANTHP